MGKTIQIALVGNPNAGKSSLFNALTGLRQKVGNFPGVTVDKKAGISRFSDTLTARVLDLPGSYSLYPKSDDERVATNVLLHPDGKDAPDIIVVIVDASNLKRNLLFASQIMDLGKPVVLALTMMDLAASKGISIDLAALERQMGAPVVGVNPRKGKGISALKKVIAQLAETPTTAVVRPFVESTGFTGNWLSEVRKIAAASSDYAALQVACSLPDVPYLQAAQRIQLLALLDNSNFVKARVQAAEIVARYARIDKVMAAAVVEDTPARKSLRAEKIDQILLHPLWGNIILLLVLFLLFQSIFWLAEYPMNWVESGFGWLSSTLTNLLPATALTDLLINGVLAGLSGIAIFIPQIAILFGFITILEDTGYMARISFLTDRLMRSVGMSGRSVMPLISGMACAVPAVMAARTIANRKERMITILVTPLMSCSARLPVYTILISLVIPDKTIGPFSLQGVVLMGLYMLGFVGALLVSWVLSLFMKEGKRSHFLLELPYYRMPRWKNVGTTMIQKATVFVRDAGKVILVISIALWALASYGPVPKGESGLVAAVPLEQSFAGRMGHWIEPAIKPIRYDWKIGVALITSFAAREVFVGTMATLYSVDDKDSDRQEATLREKMAAARTPDGKPVYTLATGVSLLLFYVFAMQCMSTLAIVKRETNSWLLPTAQFLYMGALAYATAFLAFILLR